MQQSKAPVLAEVRVLVVEDEFFLAWDLAEMLREHGAEVIGPAPTVEVAERLILEESPDCAILDMNLRGTPCGSLADLLEREGIRYLILSGYDVSALPGGARNAPYLEKPATPAAILRALSSLMAEKAQT